MALKPKHSILITSLILILLVALIPSGVVHAMEATSAPTALPLLDVFVSRVRNGQPNELRGIYVPEILAARVVQQPKQDTEFVSPRKQTVTQFSLASQLGSTGLLAHNYLAGATFFQMKEGQSFYLIYGDGKVTGFVVTKILQYQALEPNSTASNFIDLKSGRLLTASELFFEAYNRPGQVVLQTCIASAADPSWGRIFIVAEPSYESEPPYIAYTEEDRVH